MTFERGDLPLGIEDSGNVEPAPIRLCLQFKKLNLYLSIAEATTVNLEQDP